MIAFEEKKKEMVDNWKFNVELMEADKGRYGGFGTKATGEVFKHVSYLVLDEILSFLSF